MEDIKSPDINVVMRHTITPLYTLKTVFPFTPFPHIIRIYENKVALIHKYFLFRHEFTVLILDLKSVTVETGAIFACMKFELIGYEKDPPAVSYLRRSEALYARRLITGLIICNKQHIDITNLTRQELIEDALKLGV